MADLPPTYNNMALIDYYKPPVMGSDRGLNENTPRFMALCLLGSFVTTVGGLTDFNVVTALIYIGCSDGSGVTIMRGTNGYPLWDSSPGGYKGVVVDDTWWGQVTVTLNRASGTDPTWPAGAQGPSPVVSRWRASCGTGGAIVGFQGAASTDGMDSFVAQLGIICGAKDPQATGACVHWMCIAGADP